MRLPLASLQGRAGVPPFGGPVPNLQDGERFVDDDRPHLCRLVHDVSPVLLEVACGRLLDVLNAVKPGGCSLADPGEELDQVADVRAALVEVERVRPVADAAPRLGLRGNAV